MSAREALSGCYGSFPKWGDPIIDPNIQESGRLRWWVTLIQDLGFTGGKKMDNGMVTGSLRGMFRCTRVGLEVPG